MVQAIDPPVETVIDPIEKISDSIKKITVDEINKPVVTAWSKEAYQLDLTGMAKQVVINSLQLENETGQIKLLVNESIKPMMNDKMKQDVETALSNFYNKELSLSLEFSAQLNAETPSEYQQRMDDEARMQFIEELNSSDFGITMKQNFNAVLLEHSVKRTEH